MKYELNDIMTIVEAAERYSINVQTLKSKFKPSVVGAQRIESWVYRGLVKQSGKTWLITPQFMEEIL